MGDVWLTMDDGVRLAANLYRPSTGQPVPCLLEALPYRKDDVTHSYTPEYERLRDEYGYAVCRVDLRGTGNSEGLAVDEYPAREQDDLCAVIAWLAAQPWCTGDVGMFGTSYSGFNAIQVAMRRPPALRAIVPIYATDDRYTDDVHYCGGSLRLLDVIDYPTYMVSLNALPPTPSAVPTWRTEWARRVDVEPWLIQWLEEQHDGPYWRHGSLRPEYGHIAVPTMLVGGWADGYRNNTLRTYEALTRAGTPVRLLVGPWSHMDPARALPGPQVDLVAETVRWFDRWLSSSQNPAPDSGDPAIVYFGRCSGGTPAPDAVVVPGQWQTEPAWPSPRVSTVDYPVAGDRTLAVRPDVGTAAWNSCAGAPPYGQATDQRFDDAASLTWEWPGGVEILGYPRLALRIAADQPVASVSAKLCDVAPDGTSTLITRGFRNLTHRGGTPTPLTPGEPVDVEVELEACAYAVAEGHRLRLSIAGTDWPNTAAPPHPVTLAVDDSTLRLPVAQAPPVAASMATLDPPAPDGHSDVVWRIVDDVLARTTSATVDHGSTYDIAGLGSCTDRYAGTVSVHRGDFAQRATASATYEIEWPEATVRTHATVDLRLGPDTLGLTIIVEATENGEPFATREWSRDIPRRLG